LERKYNEDNNTWEVTINKDLDLYNVPELHKCLMQCIEEKKINIVINCKNMSFIDSTGLGELASIAKTVKGYDGIITITGLKQHIKKIFLLTGLDTIFIIKGDKNDR
jgi:anti-sigma B factor antagonist